MANYSFVKGEIFIDPPIDQARLTGDWSYTTIDFISSTEDPTTADRIVPVFDDEYKAYDLEPELQRVVDIFGQTHKIVGFLEEEHENRDVDHGLWRWYVKNNKVTRVVAAIVWNEPN